MNDSSEIASPEPVFGKVPVEDYGLEFFESHDLVPGYAVTKRGKSSP
jgi:hypothetical protein